MVVKFTFHDDRDSFSEHLYNRYLLYIDKAFTGYSVELHRHLYVQLFKLSSFHILFFCRGLFFQFMPESYVLGRVLRHIIGTIIEHIFYTLNQHLFGLNCYKFHTNLYRQKVPRAVVLYMNTFIFALYSSLHSLCLLFQQVYAKDSSGREQTVEQPFSLDGSQPSFRFWPRALLMSNISMCVSILVNFLSSFKILIRNFHAK